MSFGCSIGDLVAIASTIERIVIEIRAYKSAPSNFQRLAVELELFTKTCTQILQIEPASAEDAVRMDNIRKSIFLCLVPIRAFEEKIRGSEDTLGSTRWLAEHHGRSSNTTGAAQQPKIRQKIREAKDRLHWSMIASKDIDELRAVVAGQLVAVNTLLNARTWVCLSTAEKRSEELSIRLQKLIDHTRIASEESKQFYLSAKAVSLGQWTQISTLNQEEMQSLKKTISVVGQTSEETKTWTGTLVDSVANLGKKVQYQTTTLATLSDTFTVGMRTLIASCTSIVEMIEINFRALLGVYEVLVRIERMLLAKAIDMPHLKFDDPFGETLALPYQMCNTWQHFNWLLAAMFQDKPGKRLVERGSFMIMTANAHRIIDAKKWEHAVRSGDHLCMSMVLKRQEMSLQQCPRCSDVWEVESKTNRKGYTCKSCLFWFSTLDQSSNAQGQVVTQDGESIELYEVPDAPQNDHSASGPPGLHRTRDVITEKIPSKIDLDEVEEDSNLFRRIHYVIQQLSEAISTVVEGSLCDALEGSEPKPIVSKPTVSKPTVSKPIVSAGTRTSTKTSDTTPYKPRHDKDSYELGRDVSHRYGTWNFEHASRITSYRRRPINVEKMDDSSYRSVPEYSTPRPHYGHTLHQQRCYNCGKLPVHNDIYYRVTCSCRAELCSVCGTKWRGCRCSTLDSLNPYRYNSSSGPSYTLRRPSYYPDDHSYYVSPRKGYNPIGYNDHVEFPDSSPYYSTRNRAQKSSQRKPTSKTKTKIKGLATADDAARAGIPAGYSLKNWDPNEMPIMLLGTAFDANSLGKWIYDWTLYHYQPATPLAEKAGELWLLLIKLAGKMKQAEHMLPRIMAFEDRDLIIDFLKSGEKIWKRIDKLLEVCEGYMWAIYKAEQRQKSEREDLPKVSTEDEGLEESYHGNVSRSEHKEIQMDQGEKDRTKSIDLKKRPAESSTTGTENGSARKENLDFEKGQNAEEIGQKPHVRKKESTKPNQMGMGSGVAFVETIFGNNRQLGTTEKIINSMTLWDTRFDANCEQILRNAAKRPADSINSHFARSPAKTIYGSSRWSPYSTDGPNIMHMAKSSSPTPGQNTKTKSGQHTLVDKNIEDEWAGSAFKKDKGKCTVKEAFAISQQTVSSDEEGTIIEWKSFAPKKKNKKNKKDQEASKPSDAPNSPIVLSDDETFHSASESKHDDLTVKEADKPSTASEKIEEYWGFHSTPKKSKKKEEKKPKIIASEASKQMPRDEDTLSLTWAMTQNAAANSEDCHSTDSENCEEWWDCSSTFMKSVKKKKKKKKKTEQNFIEVAAGKPKQQLISNAIIDSASLTSKQDLSMEESNRLSTKNDIHDAENEAKLA